jgi:hypothetical protein
MELHEQQQFDFLLFTAVERFVERIIQRSEGAANALAKLTANPEADGIWLSQFVDAIFQDFLLENVSGACFVLKALAKRTVAPPEGNARIEVIVITMAKRAFAEVMARKAQEFLEQQAAYREDGGG